MATAKVQVLRTQSTPLTRTDAILAAIAKELNDQRGMFDRSGNLGSVSVTVKLHAGSNEVRRVEISCQKVMRRVNGRDRFGD